jgi:hypothetical protein
VLGVGWFVVAFCSGAFVLLYAWALDAEDEDAVTGRGVAIVLLPAIVVAVGALWTCVVGGSFRGGDPTAASRLRRTSLLWAVTSVGWALALVFHMLTTDDRMDSLEWTGVLLLGGNAAAFWEIARVSGERLGASSRDG